MRSFSHPNGIVTATNQLGFTLVELAIALFVIGLLLAGALIPLSTQMEVRSIADTRRVMDQINEALIGFAQANGRLPCPATRDVSTGIGAAGTEQITGTACTSLIGVIPWSTLGVPETDAWGRRFTYRVASVFSDDNSALTWYTVAPPSLATQTGSGNCNPPTPTPSAPSSFALCTLGEIAVKTRSFDTAGARGTGPLGSGLAAVFVSHGRNGYGGYQTNGVPVSGLVANTDEATNANTLGTNQGTPGGGPNNVLSYLYYSRTPTPYDAGCSDADVAANGIKFCEFDDIVYMIPAATLASRMVSAGRLP